MKELERAGSLMLAVRREERGKVCERERESESEVEDEAPGARSCTSTSAKSDGARPSAEIQVAELVRSILLLSSSRARSRSSLLYHL